MVSSRFPVCFEQVLFVLAALCALVALGEEECSYHCKCDGSCEVSYTLKTSRRSASGTGYCFSRRFGGKCGGTPSRCQRCSDKCNGARGEAPTDIMDGNGK